MEPKTAFAGVMSPTSFAKLRPSMATFNAERIPSRPFSCCELSVMVEMRGSCKEGVGCGGCEEEPGPW